MGWMVLLSLDHEWNDVWLQTGGFQSHSVVHTDPVVLLCFHGNKCRKSNFTVAGGWKSHQRFQSRVSLLRMLGLNVEPEVSQTFLPESCLQCPIWCRVHKAVNFSWWKIGTDLVAVSFVSKWISDSPKNLRLILGNIFRAASGGLADVAWRMQLCSHPLPLQQQRENPRVSKNCQILSDWNNHTTIPSWGVWLLID